MPNVRSLTCVVRSALQHITPGVALAGGYGAVWLQHKITGLPISAGQKAAPTCVDVQIAGRTSNGRRASLKNLENMGPCLLLLLLK